MISGRGERFITPDGGYIREPDSIESIAFDPDKEVVFTQLPRGVIEVRDPLFASPYRIGDQSFFTNPVVDAYVRATVNYFGLHLSTRHLLNVERYEKKEGTGRWSTLGHSVSVAAVSQFLGCEPGHTMYAATHDVAKRMGGHRSDDLLDGRGNEDAHDRDRWSFITRSGFLAYLQKEGLVDEHGIVEGLGVTLKQIVDPPEEPSVINMPSSTGDLEPERVQYGFFERNLWVAPGSAANQQAIGQFALYKTTRSTERVICLEEDAAYILWESIVRCHSEEWGELGDAILNELLMAQTRFALTYPDGATADLRRYAVGDSLYFPEEQWLRRLGSMETAGGKHFVSAMARVLEALISHQQKVHAGYVALGQYQGPVLPSWICTKNVRSRRMSHAQHTRYSPNEDALIIEINPGKQRHVNPYILARGGSLVRLEDAHPGLREKREAAYRWSGSPYDVRIDLSHPELALSALEKAALKGGMARMLAEWPQALRRVPMPNELLRARISNWGKRTQEAAAAAARAAKIA